MTTAPEPNDMTKSSKPEPENATTKSLLNIQLFVFLMTKPIRDNTTTRTSFETLNPETIMTTTPELDDTTKSLTP